MKYPKRLLNVIGPMSGILRIGRGTMKAGSNSNLTFECKTWNVQFKNGIYEVYRYTGTNFVKVFSAKRKQENVTRGKLSLSRR